MATYVVDWPDNGAVPAVSAVAAESGARVKVTYGSSVLTVAGSRPDARTLTVTSANGAVTRTCTVAFRRAAPRPTGGGAGLWSRGTEWARGSGIGG